MGRYVQPDPEQEAGWKAWVAERPDHIRVIAERFEPWQLYRIGTAGHRVIVRGFDDTEEGVRVRVAVLGRYNLVTFDREVFGVDPAELHPCDPPRPDEPVGTVFTEEAEIKAFQDMVRPQILAARRRENRRRTGCN